MCDSFFVQWATNLMSRDIIPFSRIPSALVASCPSLVPHCLLSLFLFSLMMTTLFLAAFSRHHLPNRCSCPTPATSRLPSLVNCRAFTKPTYEVTPKRNRCRVTAQFKINFLVMSFATIQFFEPQILLQVSCIYEYVSAKNNGTQ